MQRLKLLFFLAVWKRPEITEVCFMGLQRLAGEDVHDISAMAVISEESMIPLCEKYGIDYVMHENLPLGKKKNFGLSEAMKKDFDYLVEIGSDDILKNEFLEFDFSKPVMAPKEYAIVNTEMGDCRKLTSRDASYGLGRCMRKNVLEEFIKDGKSILWTDRLNSGLDNNSEIHLMTKGYKTYRISSDEPIAIDLKSEVNIWPFNYSLGVEYPLEKALEGLSENEINAIQCFNLQRV